MLDTVFAGWCGDYGLELRRSQRMRLQSNYAMNRERQVQERQIYSIYRLVEEGIFCIQVSFNDFFDSN